MKKKNSKLSLMLMQRKSKIFLRGVSFIIVTAYTTTLFAASPSPNALPTGGQVTAGQATIGQSGQKMNINQTSQSAILN
ncbi:MAG: hypothetical protein WCP33_05355, partial [Deltaproteobacteria bacterium]